jgi:hypothetical protein
VTAGGRKERKGRFRGTSSIERVTFTIGRTSRVEQHGRISECKYWVFDLKINVHCV